MQIVNIAVLDYVANAYLLTEDGENAVVIDPAQPQVLAEAKRRGLCVKFALLTHGHFDHVGGCAALSAAGAKIGCLKTALSARLPDLGEEFGTPVPDFSLDFTFAAETPFELCKISFLPLATPGHTSDSCCYLVRAAHSEEKRGYVGLFSGDTLFAGNIGRIDLPTGSAAQMRASLARLKALPFDGAVYPGHGEDTTLAKERACNPFLKGI